MPHLKLYGANVCPFVHRVRLVLAEKKLEHEYVAIDFKNKPEWYDDVLPTGKVPLLEYDADRVWESSVVCEYLEERFPQSPLMPATPGERAKVRLEIETSSGSLITPFYQLLKGQTCEERQPAQQQLLQTLGKLDAQLEGKAWLLGEQPSLADLEIYPWFERWCVLEHYRGLAIPDRLGNLLRWREAIAQSEAASGIVEPASYYIDHYRSYAHPSI